MMKGNGAGNGNGANAFAGMGGLLPLMLLGKNSDGLFEGLFDMDDIEDEEE